MESKMKALKERYGEEEGESIYHALEKEGKNKRVKKKTTSKKRNIFK